MTYTPTNLCRSISCRFLSIGPGTQSGCTKFTTALICPVAMIRGTSATDYWITQMASDARIPTVAAACCPDPVVRLQSLGEWPIEPIDRTRAADVLGDTAHAQAIELAIDGLRIGPGDDEQTTEVFDGTSN